MNVWARPERTGGGRHVDVDVERVLRDRRQDPDHLVRPVVHLEDAADDRRVAAEAPLPVLVAEDQDRRCAGLVVRLLERRGRTRAARRGRRRSSPRRRRLRRRSGSSTAEQDEPHVVELDDAVEAVGRRSVVLDFLDGERRCRRRRRAAAAGAGRRGGRRCDTAAAAAGRR